MNFLLSVIILSLCYSNEQVFVACEGNFYQGNGSIWTITIPNVFRFNDVNIRITIFILITIITIIAQFGHSAIPQSLD